MKIIKQMFERTNYLTTTATYKHRLKLTRFLPENRRLKSLLFRVGEASASLFSSSFMSRRLMSVSYFFHAAIFVALIVVITGCSGPLKQASQFSKELYRTEQINDLRNSRIGFLTTAVAQGNGLGEYKSILSDIIEKNFREEQPEINILASREILNRINSADLAGEYAGMIAGYNLTGILDRKILEKIGNVIELKYIAQPRLSSFTERTSTRLIAFGLSLISTRETSVNISLQIWDTKTGSIVWEGSGQATIAVEAMRAKPVSFEDVAEVASRGLAKKFQP